MKHTSLIAIIAAGSLATACASGPPPASSQIASAETSIQHAEDGGARQYAVGALNDAQDKLTAAKLASENGEHAQARMLADEAKLDAEYAAAVAERKEAEAALTEVRSGIRTLQEELRDNTDSAGEL
jgi:hypothetical protein